MQTSEKIKILITAGPTYEPIDPVRFICNRSSGKQGVAIAKVFAEFGFEVHLVIGPVSEELLYSISRDIKVYNVETAQEMLDKCLEILKKNVEVAICSAAVCDYRVKNPQKNKIKKGGDISLNNIEFVENPDILKTISNLNNRPKIVVGFAAETENLVDNARKKLKQKGCDFIIANDVSGGKVFAKNHNKIFILDSSGSVTEYPEALKSEIADVIAQSIIKELGR